MDAIATLEGFLPAQQLVPTTARTGYGFPFAEGYGFGSVASQQLVTYPRKEPTVVTDDRLRRAREAVEARRTKVCAAEHQAESAKRDAVELARRADGFAAKAQRAAKVEAQARANGDGKKMAQAIAAKQEAAKAAQVTIAAAVRKANVAIKATDIAVQAKVGAKNAERQVVLLKVAKKAEQQGNVPVAAQAKAAAVMVAQQDRALVAAKGVARAAPPCACAPRPGGRPPMSRPPMPRVPGAEPRMGLDLGGLYSAARKVSQNVDRRQAELKAKGDALDADNKAALPVEQAGAFGLPSWAPWAAGALAAGFVALKAFKR